MSEAQPPRRMGRSIWAIVAGFLVVVILSIGTDAALHAAGVFPPVGQAMSDALFVLATAYRTVYAILGSYITAWLASHRPMRHVWIGCGIGLTIATIGAVATWNRVPSLGPHWYPIALIVLGFPTAWVGGKICMAQLGASKPA